MLKVMIADDEERICQLIKALVDWDELHMELVGTAANGIDAAKLVIELQPDILITDIRMPGCDGLELIQKVKESNPSLEIVIISGYAHFSYAQTAIKYGVGDYLLKPINKIELMQTLEKLCAKINKRMEAEMDMKFLRENHEHDQTQTRSSLISKLLEDDMTETSMQTLQQTYDLKVQPGVFQGICIKMDYSIEQINEKAREIVLEKAVDILQGNMKSVCYEVVLSKHADAGYGILNYAQKQQEDIRRLLRDCMNQLTVQKSILGPVDFSIALGQPVKQSELLGKSLRQSVEGVQERILVGPGHLLEKIPERTGLKDQNLLEKYSRQMLHAVEVLSVEEGKAAVEILKDAILHTKNICGFEIYDLVLSAGSLFLMQTEYKTKKEEELYFRQNCNSCATITDIFACLLKLQNKILGEICEERQNDALRPIRIAKQYIQNHYQDPITLEEVSEVAGLSPSYFSALFKREIGEGFAKYLINIRIEQAKILLRESNASVSEICRQVGYNDLKHFTHTFDKATGLKPGAYRKLYG